MTARNTNITLIAKCINIKPFRNSYNSIMIDDCLTDDLLEVITTKFTLYEILDEYDDLEFVQKQLSLLITKRNYNSKKISD